MYGYLKDKYEKGVKVENGTWSTGLNKQGKIPAGNKPRECGEGQRPAAK